jgi:hypothetical protein
MLRATPRLPADLCCHAQSVDKLTLKNTSVHDLERLKCCEGCVDSSKIALELELCLQLIVSEYEQEIVRLRTELSMYKNKFQHPYKSDSLSKNMAEIEDELLLYKSIPDFKDDMRRLGDKLWPSDQATSILYYQAAALNGCTESCVRVALHILESAAPGGLVDYSKAKVTAFFVAMVLHGSHT